MGTNCLMLYGKNLNVPEKNVIRSNVVAILVKNVEYQIDKKNGLVLSSNSIAFLVKLKQVD